MKTSMRKTGNFFRKNQRVLAVALLLASLSACRKEKSIDPEVDQSELNASVSTMATGNLLFSDNLDGSSPLSSGVSLQTSTSYGITVSTSQFYNGTKSVRFELHDTDPESHSGTRAELSFPKATNKNRWYSYALYIPSAQYKDDSQDEVITQFHQGGGATPALCLRTKSGHMYLRILGNIWIDLGALDKDKWHAYVLHAIHSSGSDGKIELWRDGQKIVDRNGPCAYDITTGTYELPYMKLGVYKSDWNGSSTTSTNLRVLYFDDIKMGNENATYNEMVPVPNGGTTTTTPTTTTPTTTTPTTTTPTTTTTTTSGQSVTSLTLVNSATEKDVLTITDGQTISLSALGLTKVNIRANTNPATLGSVKFELSGTQSKSSYDNKAPYALMGDDGNGNYYYGNWNPPALGTYTLKATPYTEDNVAGTAGTSKTITFTIAK
jgi:polysaccharide lyase-like protein